MKSKIFLIKLLLIFCNLNTFARELKIATTFESYPPFVMLDSQGEVIGLDIEIISNICKKKGIKYKIINQPFESLIIGLQTGKFDIAVGGLAVTEIRKKQVDFSDTFLQDKIAFIYKKNQSLKSLKKD